MRRLQPALAKVGGITLYMQPVQDLTIEDRISRTQYQYTVETRRDKLSLWSARLVEKLKALPQLRDVATDQQTGGLQAALVIDRVTASRLGITPQMIDDAIYDAFGQRQVSTLFTQLNQYHVVLETLPEFQINPDRLKDIYVRSSATVPTTTPVPSSAASVALTPPTSTPATVGSSALPATTSIPIISTINGAAVPLSAFTHFESGTAPLAINIRGNSGGHHFIQSRSRRVSGRGDGCD
jgi:multidrug efflux pump